MVSPRKKHKPKPKPVIDYPPVPTRTWIPPYERPAKPRKPLYRPPEVIPKLPVSLLKKVWHNFNIFGDRAVLVGTVSQTHKRYLYRSNGRQAPCNCVVAIAYSKLYDMPLWTRIMLDKVLDLGDHLYLESWNLLRDKSRKDVKLSEVYHTFYIDKVKVTMDMKGDKLTGKLSADFDDSPYLYDVIKDFFSKNQSGILFVQKRYFAIWTSGKGYYLFDPTEHNDRGHSWTGIPGTGFCVLFRMTNTNHLADVVKEYFDRNTNPKFVLIPCTVLRKLQIITKYPDCLQEANLEVKPVPSKVLARKDRPSLGRPKKVEDILIEDTGKGDGELIVVDDQSASVTQEVDENPDEALPPAEAPTKIPTTRLPKPWQRFKEPIEKPKAESVTYFVDVLPQKVGILRALTHQCDPRFSKYLGKQSLANATAAVTMLRQYKSKYWTSNILDEILKLGEVIYHDSMKALSGDQTLKVTTICKKIILNDIEYEPEIDEFSAVGKLNSPKESVLDLLPALSTFFADNDACIICGPIPLAVWSENQYFYLFDPNERDKNGLAIIREVKIGSFLKVYDIEPGSACVTWFKNLKDLVDLYMNNVPKAKRREQFILSKIQIKDYVKLPEAWNNFQPLTEDKWILNGNFSQNNIRYARETRNTQCTAIATMSIIMNTLVPVKAWTSETMDEILDKGDSYYAACVSSLQEKGKYSSSQLRCDELLKRYQIDDSKEINLEIEDCLINGGLECPEDEEDFPNLKGGFRKFFENCDSGVLTCRGLSTAIWKLDEMYYYFDSHSRDEYGLATYYGMSMIIRTKRLDDLTNAVLANLGAGLNSAYNISRIDVKVYDASDGVAKPPLNNYMAVNEETSILRASVSEISPQFKINRGKQTVPNSLVALGMTKVYSPALWTQDILDEVLVLGDKLYVKSMEVLMEGGLNKKGEEEEVQQEVTPEAVEEKPKGGKGQVQDEVPPEPVSEVVEDEEEEDSDDVTVDRVIKNYQIGVNKFEIELAQVQEGQLIDLEEMLTAVYGETEEGTDDENDKKEVVLECSLYTVSMWRENGLYYLFDPKPRDETGQVFGKDEWSAAPQPEDDQAGVEGEKGSAHADENSEPSSSAQFPTEEGEETEVQQSTNETDKRALRKTDEEGEDEEDDLYGDEAEGEILVGKPPAMEKHSSHYWREQEKAGRACTLWFTKPESLINHVVDNTPPAKGETSLKLYLIKVTNKPATKDVHDPDMGPPSDKYAGNWHEFKEVEYGKWILRGTMDQTNKLFPATNRGRQCAANAYTALAFAKLYALNKFKPQTVDHILMYGDRLFTFTRNARKKELQDSKELELSDNEIDIILQNENYGADETTKHFCLANDKVKIDIVKSYISGEINAQNVEEELDVQRGLELFFVHNKFGILSAKDLLVAVWRTGNIFYMFDQKSRGPSGFKCINGVACITRYMNIEDLVSIFLRNLSKDGINKFSIHMVTIEMSPCPREEVRKKVPKNETQSMITGFAPVVPGKKIVRGNISQEHQMFGRGRNVQFAPMALVALAMTLVHKSMYWTKPIIDEIIVIGDKVYASALEKLGYEFNPWEQKLTLDLAPSDFKIGGLKASCELRPYDEEGIMNVKASEVLNLRQGIEKFFEENTHGVIETESLVLAIWEETEPKRTTYMFDPNPRGPTGMPLPGGTACVLTFESAKMAADHFMSLIPDKADGPFRITPVEVCVGTAKTKVRKKLHKEKKTPYKKGIPTLKAATPKEKRASPQKVFTPSERRRLRELEKKKREEEEIARLAKLGRKEYYTLPGGEISIVRGNRSMFSKYFSAHSRGYQDIPVCLTSYVMERLWPLKKWTDKVIDMILDIGDQLYKDSYVMYKPPAKKLGLSCVIRDIIIKDTQVTMGIGKPVCICRFDVPYLEKSLEMFFRQKNYCMICVNEKFLALFFKDGQYYVFDPHGVDVNANRVSDGDSALLRFDKLIKMCERVVANIKLENQATVVFSIIVVSVKNIKKLPKLV